MVFIEKMGNVGNDMLDTRFLLAIGEGGTGGVIMEKGGDYVE